MNDFWTNVGLLTVAAIAVSFALYAAARGWDAFVANLRAKRELFSVVALFGALLVYAATKSTFFPCTEKPNWLNVTTSVNTNTWNEATVEWTSSLAIPATEVISIDVAVFGNAQTNWLNRANVLYGVHSNVLSFASLVPSNPTNYICRVRSEYVPGRVEIVDLVAVAMRNERKAVCTWSNPTNIVGMAAVIEHREKPSGAWRQEPPIILQRSNTVTVVGNFVSRGVDREFRVRVPSYGVIDLTNLTTIQTGGAQ